MTTKKSKVVKRIIRKCSCDCGGILVNGENKFLHGHHRRGVKASPETLLKMSISLKKKFAGTVSRKKGKILYKGKFVNKESVKLPLCKCGCGERVSKLGNRFVHGHYKTTGGFKKGTIPWNKGLTKETDARLKESSDRQRTLYPKSCECGCGNMTASGKRFVTGHNQRGVKQSPESIQKRTEKFLGQKRPNGNWNPWSTGLTKETSSLLRKTAKKQSVTMKEKFKDKEFCKMWASTHGVSPNQAELKLNVMLQNLFPDEWKFVGDFKTWLGGKNPDFMNVNGQKKLIELFGNYWHKDDDPQDRINHFSQYGFKTLVVWESELEDMNLLGERLQEFHIQQ